MSDKLEVASLFTLHLSIPTQLKEVDALAKLSPSLRDSLSHLITNQTLSFIKMLLRERGQLVVLAIELNRDEVGFIHKKAL